MRVHRARGHRFIVAFALVAAAGLALEGADDPSFEVVEPTRVDLAFQPGTLPERTLTIRNTGKVAIAALAVEKSTLVDSATMREVQIPGRTLGGCDVGASCSWEIAFARPAYAGNYSGSLTIVAGTVRRSVPVLFRTRGPNFVLGLSHQWFRDLPRLPTVLFWLVTLVGCAMSAFLDAWFAGGGRRRTQARLLLAKSRDTLTANLIRATAWQDQFQARALSKSQDRWHVALAETEQAESNAGTLKPEELEQGANRIARQADDSNVLWTVVTTATNRLKGARDLLVTAVMRVDEVDPDKFLDISGYRKACIAALHQAAVGNQEHGAAVEGIEASTVPVPLLRKLSARVKWMDRLYVSLSWIVVGLVAYVTFYDRALAFGTVRDYTNLFLWSLGLTQTGSQILARTKSTAARL